MSDTIARTIIGNSGAIRNLRGLIEIAGPTKLPVLIQGPTGSGKELVAAALHQASGRRGAFVAFNVCAIGETMFEDALFGHARGAFTGALVETAGFLLEANHGTAFFDEISGLQLGLQAKLLRAIETGEFRPIGAKRDVRSDFRVVSATNEPIDQLVADARVRSDLAHRIGGVILNVPSLAERPDDVPLLVRHFLERSGYGHLGVQAEAIGVLQEHDWPGNVRELKQLVEWAAVMSTDVLSADVLRVAMAHRSRAVVPSLTNGERGALRALLEEHAWDIDSAATSLGVHRATLYRRMKQLQLRRARLGLVSDSSRRANSRDTHATGATLDAALGV
jgi:DNA-binding NtrC family response regulator